MLPFSAASLEDNPVEEDVLVRKDMGKAKGLSLDFPTAFSLLESSFDVSIVAYC